MRDRERQEWLMSHQASGEDLSPEHFPQLSTLSAAFFFSFTPVARDPQTPEVVLVPRTLASEPALTGVLAEWNFLWEASQYRRQVFEQIREAAPNRGVPALDEWISRLPEANIYLFPDSPRKYALYAPLYHLIPKRILDRYGLPACKRPTWPHGGWWYEEMVPKDFEQRLSRAFAEHIWKHIDSGSRPICFSSEEPLVMLSHNLDYWLPNALRVVEGLMAGFERCEPDNKHQEELLESARLDPDPDVAVDRPHKGGTLWIGEDEAEDVTEAVVAEADRDGQLRGIVDAVRSNRVVDDFSSCWSFAKEDFERKIYSKRSKVRVSFVELKDTLPVHGPSSEYTDNLLWEDFTALLDQKERHIVVCLRSGMTRLGDIAKSLGYANHSPISKALTRIREKATHLLN